MGENTLRGTPSGFMGSTPFMRRRGKEQMFLFLEVIIANPQVAVKMKRKGLLVFFDFGAWRKNFFAFLSGVGVDWRRVSLIVQGESGMMAG